MPNILCLWWYLMNKKEMKIKNYVNMMEELYRTDLKRLEIQSTYKGILIYQLLGSFAVGYIATVSWLDGTDITLSAIITFIAIALIPYPVLYIRRNSIKPTKWSEY